MQIRLVVIFGRMPLSSVPGECADERAVRARWPRKPTAPVPPVSRASGVLY
jgi:hypothetical protein